MRSPRSMVKAAAFLLLGSAALLCPRRAPACGNAVNMEVERVSIVLTADKMLRDGKPKATAELLMQQYPSLKTSEPKEKLVLRARRIVALAVVRTDGLLPVPAFAASTSDDRRKNLEWAIEAMRKSAADTPDNPVVQAALAEALATLPEHQQEAFDILDRLARRDVLPSAHGYHTLGHLRHLVGDTEGERSALEKSAKLTKAPPPPEGFPMPRPSPHARFFGRM
jgi:hypothetical protein